MNENAALELYARLPVLLQNAACWYYGRKEARTRYSPVFRERLEALERSEWWSEGDMEAAQDESIRDLVRHGYENVPYYGERMRELRLSPSDVRGRADLPKLPILTKEDVRANMERLVSRTARRERLVHRHTSGTTGKSLHFYSSPESIAFQWAVWWRHRARFGLRLDALGANFTGKLVVPPSQARPPYWRWNRPMRQALVNMHHLTPAKIADVVRFLDRHPFEFYSGYPSIVHALALTAMEAGLTLQSPPRLVVTGAENVLDFQRRDIERFTGAVLTDQYGFSEGCGNASHCPEMRYHEDFEFSYLECVDPAPAEGGGTRGRLVCTGFANYDFPFIRYEVGDTAVWADPAKPCACGRPSRVISSIEGRMDDYVVTPEGRRIMRFDYIFKDTHHVRESQVVQDRPGAIRIRVVRRPGYGGADERFITAEIHRWISPALHVEYEYVDEIERERNGKFRAVRSYLPRGGTGRA